MENIWQFKGAKVAWQFTTEDARTKLAQLYPQRMYGGVGRRREKSRLLAVWFRMIGKTAARRPRQPPARLRVHPEWGKFFDSSDLTAYVLVMFHARR